MGCVFWTLLLLGRSVQRWRCRLPCRTLRSTSVTRFQDSLTDRAVGDTDYTTGKRVGDAIRISACLDEPVAGVPLARDDRYVDASRDDLRDMLLSVVAGLDKVVLRMDVGSTAVRRRIDTER